ncbi:tripartite tricarboxylate transporter substrate-binding protein [Paucibacter sp. O1-1]|nr:tripartite tricarboxylate transporter substrate-binding protein [Paucibacter sp. O1-1]MDA3825050.1 tripartite tricarboxylate transporter substrate-binding protein [Paucibacter sp. O1-1]
MPSPDRAHGLTPAQWGLGATLTVYLLASTSFQGRRFEDVLTAARAQPGKLTVATSGVGTVGNIMLEQIKRNAKVDMIHVPYKGAAQAATDAAGGHFDLFLSNPSPNLNALVSKGTLRVLAVTGPARLSSLPETPTFAELGLPQANLTSKFGLFAPKGIPADVLKRLNAAVVEVVTKSEVQDALTRLDNVVAIGSPMQFTATLKAESEANEKLIREANIRLE